MKKIYVGNISYNTTEGDLESLFSQYGKTESVKIIQDRLTGKSKGFGFVEMDEPAAEQAIEKLNGMEVDGRKIVVNEAKPPSRDRDRRGGGGGGRGSFQRGGRGGGGGGGGGRERRY